jgi:MGT family glycosyltransferase
MSMAHATIDGSITLVTLDQLSRINRIRAAYGLRPTGFSMHATFSRQALFIIPSLPELDFNRTDIPAPRRYVGPCVWNRPAQRTTKPDWFDAVSSDRPWVHVTEGTTFHREPFLIRAATEGLGGKPYEVVITTGSGSDLDALRSMVSAPNVHIEPWLSYDDLLPRCKVVVTTGGAGTIMASLMAGVPLVVVPTHWDKRGNADRIAEANLGVRLNPEDCTPGHLADAVERVLTQPIFHQQAQAMAQKLARAPGAAGAAALLEDLASKEAAIPAGFRQ